MSLYGTGINYELKDNAVKYMKALFVYDRLMQLEHNTSKLNISAQDKETILITSEQAKNKFKKAAKKLRKSIISVFFAYGNCQQEVFGFMVKPISPGSTTPDINTKFIKSVLKADNFAPIKPHFAESVIMDGIDDNELYDEFLAQFKQILDDRDKLA